MGINTSQDRIKKEIQDYWDYNSRLYEKCGLGSEEECNQWKQDFQEILGKDPLNILDIGTGTGFIGILLAEAGHTVTGLDFSQKMMDFAREKAARKKVPYMFVTGDAENPEFKIDTFDASVCRYLLWTLPHPEKAIAEWVRITKPGGIICIIDGDWEVKGIQRRIGGRLLKMYRFACLNACFNGRKYSDELNAALPNHMGVSKERLIQYLQDNNLEDILTKDLNHIRDIQSRNLPWYLKYSYYNDTYAVWGRVKKE